ncbi:proteasomal ATPase-associated factor 1-like isoform X2 [Xenia sp. Carnegie-2017]|uniref:proteasomal ATPase-associated factor 1-like isoform X2 n=1 Tax=Xenia sp. Carnegie-2017 TaxID=2897299 RepID=UPI001F041EFA|nr:proteasomal ATPase-associated factor 1-like isoform X2 [Xenia sp. Carnegie-2017]
MAVKIQPFFNIQHDWNDVLSSSDKVWISCSKKGWPSVYGEVITKGNGKEKDLVVTNGFEIKNFDKTSITVSYPKWNCSTKFVASSNTFKNIHLKSVRGLDISPGGSLGVSSGDDKSLNLWQSSDGTVRRVLEGHVTDVTSCQFFPSGVVVLTGGSDMQLKIWSAEDGSCPVTLKGHRGGISDTAIIEKGRNVVSCSRDGSARLWDCGTATCLGVITECSSAINACAAATVNDSIGDLGVRDEPTNEKEVGSDGKLLLLAREDKILQGVGLHSRQKLFELSGSSAFNACCFMSERMAVAGTQDGCLHKYDLRYTSKPLSIVKMSGSSILSMTKFNETCLVSTGDGSCFLWTDEDAADVCLTGPDCDSVYKVRANGRYIYTACRDAKIRKYIL